VTFFVSSSFYTQSDEVQDYLKELNSNIQKLANSQSSVHVEYLTERVTNQFTCLKNLINSVSVNTKTKRQDSSLTERVNQMKQLAARVTRSSQDLYAELSKLQEYECRLEQMVQDKQRTLTEYKGIAKRTELQQQVLITQQRLGRCRQALSKVEEQIQELDNRQMS
jgi:primosomal replication protein N''